MRSEQKARGWDQVDANIGGKERIASMFLGGGLIALALIRRTRLSKLWLLPGVMLLARGRSGRSVLYTLFDVSTMPKGGPERRKLTAREARGEAPAAGEQVAPEAQPTADSPHPRVPGTHEHTVPPTELGVPAVQVSDKLMSEIAGGTTGPGREAEPEPER